MTKKDRNALADIVGGDNVMFGTTELIAYSYDSQPFTARPEAMVNVRTTGEVAGVLRYASKRGIPVTPRGAGSGMTGGSVPEHGGIVLNLEPMDRIVSINAEDRIALLQPGVITGVFQSEAAKLNLFYPPEPASSLFSSIGGNVAESAGGLGCVKYGLTKHFVKGLVFVTVDGHVVKTGVYANSTAPFDVGAVLVGSEGTLAVITEIAMKLIPRPEMRAAFLAFYPSLPLAAKASNAVLRSGVVPSVLEFMDGGCIETVRDYAAVPVPDETGALLVVEIDGDTATVDAGRGVIGGVLGSSGAIDVITASDEESRLKLWTLRKSVSPAIMRIAPLKFNEDVCVPLSAIPSICDYIEELGRRRDVRVVTFGHSGDGNLHVNFMTDHKRPEEVARVKDAIGELFTEVVRRDGTLSGEHGIGIAKRPYIGIALDEATLAFQKKIKQAFDGDNILNPGKMFTDS